LDGALLRAPLPATPGYRHSPAGESPRVGRQAARRLPGAGAHRSPEPGAATPGARLATLACTARAAAPRRLPAPPCPAPGAQSPTIAWTWLTQAHGSAPRPTPAL